jgi:hypothetical protein
MYCVVEDINRKMLFHEELSKKFPGSSPDLVIRFFNLPYPSSRTMDPVSTHPLKIFFGIPFICKLYIYIQQMV